MTAKVLEIELPDYKIETPLDYDFFGKKLDDLLLANLPEGAYLERSIGLIDHPGLSLDQLTDLVKKHGTDKYDPSRKSIFDEEFSSFRFDIHASEFGIRAGELLFDHQHNLSTYSGQNIYCFHKLTPFDRGYAIRLNLLMVYDKNLLHPAIQLKPCEERILNYSRFLYRFESTPPVQALKLIIKIR